MANLSTWERREGPQRQKRLIRRCSGIENAAKIEFITDGNTVARIGRCAWYSRRQIRPGAEDGRKRDELASTRAAS
jgi:hypothetical protein